MERCRWVHFGASFQNVSEKSKDRLARAGEEEAIFLLREKGYTVLHRNILLPEGEIDVVARKGRLLVFIEVKTRRQGDPWNAVTEAKQRRQCAMAGRFMSLCRIRDVPVRFDIISIVWPEDASPKIEHWENAFQPNDLYRSA